VGPGGAGKTSIGQRIAREPGWRHIAEDKVWDELPRDPFSPRTDSEKAAVQRRVVELIQEQIRQKLHVALDFILYENPPQPITYYQTELVRLEVEVITRVLCPSVETIMARQASRANSHDTEVEISERRHNAEHQVRCAKSEHIDTAWMVDSSDLSLEEVYNRYFASLVKGVLRQPSRAS
jgi:adenylate kinase family enzyme